MLTLTPIGQSVPTGALTPSLRQSIERAIADVIPAEKNGALLAVVDQQGVHAVIARKFGDHWALSGEVERTWGGDVSGSVSVMVDW